MKFELFDFQQHAVNELIKKMNSMQQNFADYNALSYVALTAPTGAGKTVIASAVAECLFYGNDIFPGDPQATILWLSDSPSLNDQTLNRFAAAADLLNPITSMITISNDFAKNHNRLLPGYIYFLNRQLLGKGKKLVGEAEGGRSFYDVLNATIEDADTHLFLFIDEAHRGIGKGKDKGTSESENKTIYSIIIDGQPGINQPMPCVVGISATAERFEKAMEGRKDRDKKSPVNVSPSEVRASGLIKDSIELRTPKESTNITHQDLTLACKKLQEVSKAWKEYCLQHSVSPAVIPLLVVQVEDKISSSTLAELCRQIHRDMPELDVSTAFANVFGEHEDITTDYCNIPYINPSQVSEETCIRILFAKDAVSTGWDCPRAEVIYSRRKRTDPTYIAQLIGRMVRTPLARRIEGNELLNTVACYLPEFDETTVMDVVNRLKDENIPVGPQGPIVNPVDVGYFGDKKQTNQQVVGRMPNVDAQDLKICFEGIATREVRNDTPNYFVDLRSLIDLIQSDIDPDSNLERQICEEFFNNIEGAIHRYPNEYRRSYNEIKRTKITIKRINPITGEILKGYDDIVENDSDKLNSYYKKTIAVFGGASDAVNYCINRYAKQQQCGDEYAVEHFVAAGNCLEIVEDLEQWSKAKAKELMDQFSASRYLIAPDNTPKWDKIEGNIQPYIERYLSIASVCKTQNSDADKYSKHIICDDNGWAYLKLNTLEKKIVEAELNKHETVAFYRNPSRVSAASLSIPYNVGERLENMHPDFIFFVSTRSGIQRVIVDPHGAWLSDSVEKLRGYVQYIRDFPNMFVKVLVVSNAESGELRYLDLIDPKVQAAVNNFTGTMSNSLFSGPLSKKYYADKV